MEDHGLVIDLALIAILGIAAQWLAALLRLPAIVLLSTAGILAGPVTGWLHPEEIFGPLLQPMIAIAVAVILFEGGLNLNFHELRQAGPAVRRLILIGIPLSWLFGTLACHYLAGLSWPIAILFGGILVVTGPTVILPLLRQARLTSRPAAILKWEGIINDPIGALLAVLVFEYLSVWDGAQSLTEILAWLVPGALAAAAVGVVAGRLLVAAFNRGLAPEYLKGPGIIGVVLGVYTLDNLIAPETGLIGVTALGITLANARLTSIEELRRIKEYLTILLVSGVFVVLTATLDPALLDTVDWGLAAFVAAILFAVRPAAVLLSTIGTPIGWNERLLIAWIAPRGVVAVAVSGFFGPALAGHGYPDAALLVPLAFAIVFATVIAHGFSIGWLARRLDLAAGPAEGALIVGGSRFAAALAAALIEAGRPVLIADTRRYRLMAARRAEIPIYQGEILSEAAQEQIDLGCYGTLIAATDNDAYNALVCTSLAAEFGRDRVFQLPPDAGGEADPGSLRRTVRGIALTRPELDHDELERRCRAGWRFQTVAIPGRSAEAADDTRRRAAGGEPLLLLRAGGGILAPTQTMPPAPGAGDTLLRFVPPADADPARPPPAAGTTTAISPV